jgi:hypothetical protein
MTKKRNNPKKKIYKTSPDTISLSLDEVCPRYLRTERTKKELREKIERRENETNLGRYSIDNSYSHIGIYHYRIVNSLVTRKGMAMKIIS